MRWATGWMVILAAACLGQEPPRQAEGARDLFYFGKAPKDELPPAGKPSAHKAPGAPAPAAGAAHLGLRYTLLLAGAHGSARAVDPERNFHKGDCLALNLESNRSGYLYVLAKESGGDWIPLFPSPELARQDNRIDPGQTIRAPKGTCFEIEDPPGTETLFVVLSRDTQDINELIRGMKGPGAIRKPADRPAQVASSGTIDNAAVEHIAEKFGTRDLVFRQTVGAPQKPDTPRNASPKTQETEHAVYVVTGSNKPSTTLVTKVTIRHR